MAGGSASGSCEWSAIKAFLKRLFGFSVQPVRDGSFAASCARFTLRHSLQMTLPRRREENLPSLVGIAAELNQQTAPLKLQLGTALGRRERLHHDGRLSTDSTRRSE